MESRTDRHRPYLNIQYPVVTENNGEKKVSIKDLILFPDELLINGQLKTEILKRSLYEVNVYQSELTLKGSFSSEELIKSRIEYGATAIRQSRYLSESDRHAWYQRTD